MCEGCGEEGVSRCRRQEVRGDVYVEEDDRRDEVEDVGREERDADVAAPSHRVASVRNALVCGIPGPHSPSSRKDSEEREVVMKRRRTGRWCS